MINGKFNFILKVMFWITRQPINQVIDNPDCSPQTQGWETQRYLPSSPEMRDLLLWGLNQTNAK